jgi:NitT/TauT family transport system permease protein
MPSNASVTGIRPAASNPVQRAPTGFALWAHRMRKSLRTPMPYLTVFGIVLWIATYYVLSEGLQVWRFAKLPGPVEVITDWTSKNPAWGLSIHTPDYYRHISISCFRVFAGFAIATLLGVPLGLFMGWSTAFKDYTFPVLETLRPIPILAWVPLAILMFTGIETSVVFLATLASFFVTTLNTLLGVESIDRSYFRAAACLGSKPRHVFWHIIVPGAMPFIFTGLQISIAVAWFSLVAAEMVSGEFGLGYVIMNAYTTMTYVPMVIGMLTLGFVGWASSAMVRLVGNRMMQWRVRALALEGR